MAKKQFFNVIGLKNGKGLTELAQFDEKKDANWHIKSTFDSLGFDQLFVKATSVKDKELYIKLEDAQNKEPFLNTLIIMNKLDWETVKTSTQFNTLLGFLYSNELEKTAQLGKLSDVLTSNEVAISEDEFAVKVIQDLNTAIPLDKAKTKLTKAIMDELLGSDEDSEDDASEEDEPAVEVVEDEPEVEEEEEEEVKPTPKAVKEPKATKEEPKVETVVEDIVEPIVEKVVEEVVEEVSEPTVEKEVSIVEEPVLEIVEEEVSEPTVEKEVSIEDLMSDETEVFDEKPVVEETKVDEVDLADFDFDFGV